MATDKYTIKNSYKLFEKYSYTLTSIVYVKTEGEKQILNKLLDDFNSLDYTWEWMENNNRAVLVINQCCSLIPPHNTIFVDKACELFKKLLLEQHVTLEGLTLNVTYNWCMEVLKTAQNPLKVLQLLQSLPNIDQKLPLEIGETLKKNSHNFEIYYTALRCLEKQSSFEIYEEIFNKGNHFEDPLEQCKCWISAIRGLSNLITPNLSTDEISIILGVVKIFSNYGLPGFVITQIEKIPPVNYPLPDKVKPFNLVKGKYVKKLKKKHITSLSDVENENLNHNEFNAGMTKTSDSDFSDNDLGNSLKSQMKVRHAVLVLLGTLINKIDSKILTKFVPVFLPFLTARLKDESSRCRSESLIILSLILTRFKPFFNLADNFTQKHSFTSLSQIIADILKNLHIELNEIINIEKTLSVLTRILITISDLVRASLYNKLETGILECLSDSVIKFINHKDIVVRTSAISCFGCIASVPNKTKEIDKIILKDNFAFGRFCLDSLNNASSNIAVVNETLQVFGALVRNYFLAVFSQWFKDVLNVCYVWDKEPVKFYLAKYIEAIAESSRENLDAEDDGRISDKMLSSLWVPTLQEQISKLLQSNDCSLRTVAIDCISNLGVYGNRTHDRFVFDYLPRGSQVVFITHLFGGLHDESPQVRSSVLRSLAAIIQVPSISEDDSFFMDAVDGLIKVHKDSVMNVRYQAAWLLGALTDVLIQHEDKINEFAETELLKLMGPTIYLANDNKQIVPNALRGLGNLLKILPESFIKKNSDIIVTAVSTLINNAKSGSYLKARWNACYALGHSLSNPAICQQTDLKTQILPVLFQLIESYKNFKVRISAGFALSMPRTREDYGEFFIPTWTSLLSGLDNAENMDDFNEYQHRDQLIDQMCLGLSHLVCLTNESDLTILRELLNGRTDILQKCIRRCRERTVPEKSSEIYNAELRILELKNSITDKNIRKCIDILYIVFSDSCIR